jgi:galactokinase
VASPARILSEAFETRYGNTPQIFRAPGRVNLIGEHTDYNFGFVLPIAIDMACYAASAPNVDGVLRVYSMNSNEGREWPAQRIPDLLPAKDWSDYVIGVARQIPNLNARNVMIYGTVPLGSGLSSSAALEVSSALALGWPDPGKPSLELAKLCQAAENRFVGLPSGIMDQYVSVFGRDHAALLIDCRTLASEHVPLPDDVAIVAVNTMVKHELGQSAYRERVAECALAVEEIRAAGAVEVENLRDATEVHLALITDEVARKRARHVISENQRVLEFVAACRGGDLAEMGRLFLASHRSLQHDYAVSCEELDFLVDTAMETRGVYGARMTGGGFGGCTVNLVDPGAVDGFESAVHAAYRDRFGIDPAFYRVRPSAGAGPVDSRDPA